MSEQSIATLREELAEEQQELDNLLAQVKALKTRPTGDNDEPLNDDHADIRAWKKNLKAARAKSRAKLSDVGDLKKDLEKLDPSNKVFTKLDTSNLGACKLNRNAFRQGGGRSHRGLRDAPDSRVRQGRPPSVGEEAAGPVCGKGAGQTECRCRDEGFRETVEERELQKRSTFELEQRQRLSGQ